MAQATQAPPAIGTFCWNELWTKDAKKAQTFYSSLFGWKTEEMNMGPGKSYTICKTADQQAAGVMQISSDKPMPPGWVAYVNVKDVDASTKKAETLGAKTCVPPTDIPNIGRFSIITDPTGVSVGLFKSKG